MGEWKNRLRNTIISCRVYSTVSCLFYCCLSERSLDIVVVVVTFQWSWDSCRRRRRRGRRGMSPVDTATAFPGCARVGRRAQTDSDLSSSRKRKSGNHRRKSRCGCPNRSVHERTRTCGNGVERTWWRWIGRWRPTRRSPANNRNNNHCLVYLFLENLVVLHHLTLYTYAI